MPDKPVFNINEQLFEKLIDWQQKIEEKDRLEAEAELETAKKANKPTHHAKES